jgi:hypothetical protein
MGDGGSSFSLINYRYSYRMPTVITTNARLMSRMDERIRSRGDLGLVNVVHIKAKDHRYGISGVHPGGGTRGGRGGYTR